MSNCPTCGFSDCKCQTPIEYIDEVCECGKTARYLVTIEVEMLYDLPLCKRQFYICAECINKPQKLRFTRDVFRGIDERDRLG